MNHLDLFKAFAANLIVLHHLAFYGPMTDHTAILLPGLTHWLAQHGRLAVQVFFAIGGFLAARSLAKAGGAALTAIPRRFLKLVPPYLAALVLAVGAAALARLWMQHDSIPASPTPRQLFAHALLLQDVLGIESLSAGMWYIAIDFQLFVCMAILVWAVHRAGAPMRSALFAFGVAVACAVSVYYVNRHSEWDVWGLYFFGSYGFGALAWWATVPGRSRAAAVGAGLLIAVLCGTALALDYRERLAVSAAAALVVLVLSRRGRPVLAQARWPAFFGRIAYAMLLVHFPVCLVVNAFFTRYVEAEPLRQTLGVALAWIASIGAATLFQRWVEAPLAALVQRWQSEDATPAVAAGYRRTA
ncbi:acyltransferase [Oxalobacteraceae bacterium OM1]|nr:acyltransferase [Oxalobacteraceae bacterium OM1]